MRIYIPQPSDDPTDNAVRLATHFDWDQMGETLAALVQAQDDPAIPAGERRAIGTERHAAAQFARGVMTEPTNGDLWTLAARVASDQPTFPRVTMATCPQCQTPFTITDGELDAIGIQCGRQHDESAAEFVARITNRDDMEVICLDCLAKFNRALREFHLA